MGDVHPEQSLVVYVADDAQKGVKGAANSAPLSGAEKFAVRDRPV